MKKIVLFTLILVMSISTFAQSWKKTMIRIREERGRTISVTIDGRKYNRMNRTLTIGDLPAGMHTIKVFAYNSNGYGYRGGKLIYEGRILTKPSKIYYCTVYNFNIDVEENCCIDNYGHWNNNDNWDTWDDTRDCWNNNQNWHNDRDYNDRDNNNYYNNWNNHNDNNDWNNNTQNHHNHNHDNDNYNNNYNDDNWNSYSGVLSQGRYEQLIAQVRKASFETSKANVAKQALQSNKITVQQLIGIVSEFSFESTKLDFIKNNYAKIADKKNMFLVNDVFTFQSSKDELTTFLERQGR